MSKTSSSEIVLRPAWFRNAMISLATTARVVIKIKLVKQLTKPADNSFSPADFLEIRWTKIRSDSKICWSSSLLLLSSPSIEILHQTKTSSLWKVAMYRWNRPLSIWCETAASKKIIFMLRLRSMVLKNFKSYQGRHGYVPFEWCNAKICINFWRKWYREIKIASMILWFVLGASANTMRCQKLSNLLHNMDGIT